VNAKDLNRIPFGIQLAIVANSSVAALYAQIRETPP
jgi:hypothetical protein